MESVATLLRSVSPRHRKWRRLLAGLTLNPDELPSPLEPPSEHDFLICGIPRSGTALLTAALYQPPSVVTAMEPWDGFRLPPATLFASFRKELQTTGELRRGRLDIDALLADGTVQWCRDGSRPRATAVGQDFLLGIKMPAFWRYLALLPSSKFLVCIRDPVEVISSFRSTGGRLAEGLDYDIPFNQRMNRELLDQTDDAAVRRVLLYDYIAAGLLPHLQRADVCVVRYERWLTDREGLLSDISSFLGHDVSDVRVRVRAPRHDAQNPDDIDLVRRYSRAASALGYATVGGGS